MAGVIAQAGSGEPRGCDDASRGDATWVTLFSSDRTPTAGMSAGVMEVPPGGFLAAHRHTQAEMYYVVAGAGVLTIDGVATAVASGAAACIPSDAEHGVRNDGEAVLRIFYVFPTDRFDEVVYRFSHEIGT